MSLTLARDLRGTATSRDVEALIRSMREPGVGRIVDATDLESDPTGSTLAYTAWRRQDVAAEPVPTIGLVDVTTGAVRLLDDPTPGSSRRWPRWSPDGVRLACVSQLPDGTDEVQVVDVATGTSVRATTEQPRGRVEAISWSPDGGSIAMLVAEPGAEISDVFGSGRVAGSDDLPAWCPEVSSDGRSGWRRVWVTGIGDVPRRVGSPLNVWEFCWAGPGHLAAIASAAPDEDAWYDADLVLLSVAEGPDRLLLNAPSQFASPAARPGGRQVSVVRGTASDRGLVAGELVVVDVDTAVPRTVTTSGLHVTSQTWRGADRIVVAGLRAGDSVAAEVRVHDGGLEQEWVTTETFGPGDLLPVAVPCGEHDVAVVLESHTRAPTIGVVRDRAFVPLVDLAHPGSAVTVELCSTLRPVSWVSSDGLPIEGYLATPGDRSGPYPLVVLVHGGPVWRWRDAWTERVVQVPLLLARGFAVLLPNPRGSQGKGEEFVRGIIGEVGGLDVDDVLAGVDQLVAEGVARASSVGVMGSSYGGFLAAWLATRPGAFAAAMAVSPVTDWVSQHFTTNIPQSDVRFFRGEPLDPLSQYRSRSPLVAASHLTCPLLLTAGQRDLATPPSQALEMHRALVELGVDSDIALYPLEGHDVHEWSAVIDHCTRMLLWFEHYLND